MEKAINFSSIETQMFPAARYPLEYFRVCPVQLSNNLSGVVQAKILYVG